MAQPPPPTDEELDESWMGTYADAITLLMAFFVLLVSFSKVDLEVYDKVANGLADHMAKEDRESQSDARTRKENLKDAIINASAEEVVKMGTDAQGSITLELDGGQFFKPGSADLRDQAIPVLQSMYDEFASPLYAQFNITVEGHTDDDPISTFRFPSNWELSAGRASTVVRFFQTAGQDGKGIDGKRLSAVGFSDTQPKVPNRDVNGNPILENQIINRRVVIRANREPIYNEIKIPKFRRKKAKTPKKADIK